MLNQENTFIEIECSQRHKDGESACGDDFKSIRINEEERSISVLSDGLGSGVKAALMAHMTTSMVTRFVSNNMDITSSFEIIMDSLPVCEVRKISYATFTSVDILAHGLTRIIEMDNPGYIHLRGNKVLDWKKITLISEAWPERKILFSEFRALPGDRIIFFTDGISQAGLGHSTTQGGWQRKGCLEFIQKVVDKDKNISARELSTAIVGQALSKNPGYKAIDDISCAVIYFRKPRWMRLLTGPPYDEINDRRFAENLLDFDGHTVICGGTTAQIIARELKREMQTDIPSTDGAPPLSEVDGVDLVTEGILTLTEVENCLEEDSKLIPSHAAAQIINMFQDCDVIEFLVGTRVNEAHHDPNLPIDLEIRRNIIKRLKTTLENRFRKRVILEYY